jgi:hypothetical protein
MKPCLKGENSMFDKLPPEVQQAMMGAGGLLPTALLARLLYHQHLVRKGERKFWSIELVWEAPTAIFCAVVGGGLASYFHLDPMATHAVIGVTGWLGPRGVEVFLARCADRYLPKKEKS